MKITKKDLSKMIQEELKATKYSNGYRNTGLEKLSAANNKKVAKKAPKKAVKEALPDSSRSLRSERLKGELIKLQNLVEKSNMDPLVAKQVYMHLRQAIMAIK